MIFQEIPVMIKYVNELEDRLVLNMSFKEDDLNGIYRDICENLGEEVARGLHRFYKGQQITFPMRLYSQKYVIRYISNNYNGKNSKKLARDLGYTERWIKEIIKNNNLKVGED
ncbi:Mor transcription activator family protein [Clostridium sp. YIM B02506]|uniref:Mor transcription activator family protein n=1 Tax=Clostridium sp. YIM B02506 TaxID=2910680 RepID=UPI001EEF5853|nr:Mor transcription activator family protein [Clostridium sp. YIM B02506]